MSASAGVLEDVFGSGCRGLQHRLHSPSAEHKVAVEPNTNHEAGNGTLAKSIARNVYQRSSLSRNTNCKRLSSSYDNMRYDAVLNLRVMYIMTAGWVV